MLKRKQMVSGLVGGMWWDGGRGNCGQDVLSFFLREGEKKESIDLHILCHCASLKKN